MTNSPTCKLLRPHDTYHGKQGFDYFHGISAESACIPHLPMNTSSEPCAAVIARTDSNEQESVVPLPELDALFESQRKV